MCVYPKKLVSKRVNYARFQSVNLQSNLCISVRLPRCLSKRMLHSDNFQKIQPCSCYILPLDSYFWGRGYGHRRLYVLYRRNYSPHGDTIGRDSFYVLMEEHNGTPWSLGEISTSIRSPWPAMANPLASRPKEWPTCTSNKSNEVNY